MEAGGRLRLPFEYGWKNVDLNFFLPPGDKQSWAGSVSDSSLETSVSLIRLGSSPGSRTPY